METDFLSLADNPVKPCAACGGCAKAEDICCVQEDPAFEGIGEAIERVKASLSGGLTEDEPDGLSEDGGMDDMLTDLIREVEEMARESSSEAPDDPGKPKKDRISYL